MITNLFGLGDPSQDELTHIADTLVAAGAGALTPAAVLDYFLVLPSKSWRDAGVKLIERGVSPTVVSTGLQLAQAKIKIPWSSFAGAATVASAALSAYHGGRRNNSLGWAAWWFMMGVLFPIFTPAAAVIQGYAKPKKAKWLRKAEEGQVT